GGVLLGAGRQGLLRGGPVAGRGFGMNPIDDLFGRLRAAGKKAFMPFVPAGDPDAATTGRLIRHLASIGCHLVEVGFPFSDPIADGPVIQAAYTRALDRGVRVDDVLGVVGELTGPPGPVAAPLVGMASYSLIHRRGPAAFVASAARAGMGGLIVPDLPAEESAEFAALVRSQGLHLILLVTPTTPLRRAEKIVKLSGGFVYCVSVAGITGERDRLPEGLLDQLRRLRGMTDLPLCVGFGVSRPEHVRLLRPEADGVIVGSAIVRCLDGSAWESVAGRVEALVRPMLAALNPDPA